MAGGEIDSKIRALAELAIGGGASKRAIEALKILLENGSITTDAINALGYQHPPRVIGDIRDLGIPISRKMIRSEQTGRRMAVYVFGRAEDIVAGRIGGRSALPKKFRDLLVAKYGSVDCITGATLDPRVLQIDHRVPYRVAGDAASGSKLDPDDFMLLDATSQRAKSWSCEQCPNMRSGALDTAVCRRCFWASPADYDHIGTLQIRRTDIIWQDSDVLIHDKLLLVAAAENLTINELLRKLARQRSSES